MTHKNDDLIFQYINGELNPVEHETFKERLLTDIELQDEYNACLQVMDLLNQAGRNELKTKLAQAGKRQDDRRKLQKRLTYFGIAAVMLALVSFTIWKFIGKTESVGPPSEVIQRDTIINTPPPQDTVRKKPDTTVRAVPPPMAVVKPAKKSVKKEKQVKTDELFAMHFAPSRELSLNPGLRGPSTMDPVAAFMQAYWDKDYKGAVEYYELIPDDIKQNSTIKFEYANCMALQGKYKKAEILFREVTEDEKSRYASQATYYQALMLLKLKRVNDARDILKQISADEINPYNLDAAKLMTEL